MKLWPFKRKAAAANAAPVMEAGMMPAMGFIRDSFPGAWQQGLPPVWAGLGRVDLPTQPGIYAAIQRVASDFSIMRPQLEMKRNGVWMPARINLSQLIMPSALELNATLWEKWVIDLLTYGNAYLWKRPRGDLTLLNPAKIRLLCAEDGSMLFFECGADQLSGIPEAITLSSNEVFHAKINCLQAGSPLGVPPLIAAAMLGELGNEVMASARAQWANAARPGGMIEVPGAVNRDKLKEIKETWESGYAGGNQGKTAVLADGMKFIPYPGGVSMESAQYVDSLKLATEQIASVFGLPAFRLNAGAMPAYAGTEAANLMYFQTTLHRFVNLAEQGLNRLFNFEGTNQRIAWITDNFLRMDASAQMAVLKDGIAAGIYSINEARAVLNLKPVNGGEVPRIQMQYVPIDQVISTTPSEVPTPEPEAPELEPAPENPAEAEPEEQPEAPNEAQRALIDGVLHKRVYSVSEDGSTVSEWQRMEAANADEEQPENAA